MSATGLDVFDKTLQTTNIWLDELMPTIGPERKVAWHALSAVLQTLRDRLPVELAGHVAAQLPLLVRGAFYDQWHPSDQPVLARSADEFLGRIEQRMGGTRPVNVRAATEAVFELLNRHLTRGQVEKARGALPDAVRSLWPEPGAAAQTGPIARADRAA